MKKLLLGLLAASLLAMQVVADVLQLKPGHPQEYVVQKGDTLWDISGRFLDKPWLWPALWDVNPQIENPHLIYPGDRLYLVYVDGQPRLRRDSGIVKLSPAMRSTPIDEAIPAIPLEDINAFLTRSRVVMPGELESAPYVLSGADQHVITGAGDNLFARGAFPDGERRFVIFRSGEMYIDPVTQEALGQQALEIGRGKLLTTEGEIASISVQSANEEIRQADRLLPALEQRVMASFYPAPPERDLEGLILAVEGGVTQIGYLDIVALNLGEREGVLEGNVFAIKKAAERVRDPVTAEMVELPGARAGLLMVFRTFEKMSYAIVLSANRPLKVADKVVVP